MGCTSNNILGFALLISSPRLADPFLICTFCVFRLDEIADSLSHDEIRRLSTRFNAITFHKDICLDLPVELLSHVAEYLDIENFMKAQLVSRAWREKFTSPDFSAEIIKVHFRTKWEMSDLSDPATKTTLAKWLLKAARKHLRRERGHYSSRSTCIYHRGGVPLPSGHYLVHQYNSGRVAYQFEESIIVQCLNRGQSAQPKVFVEENRNPLEWFLGDDLLIAQHIPDR